MQSSQFLFASKDCWQSVGYKNSH